MEEYYFLFFLAGAWMLFASVHDFKTREVPNWLNFSLIAFALAYRAFYAVRFSNPRFFFYGLMGLGIFVVLGFVFYYARAFGGGDAKLLMATGAVLPFESFSDYFYLSVGFIFLLFLIGAAYSFVYSIFLIKDFSKFKENVGKKIGKNKIFAYGPVLIGLLFLITSFVMDLFLAGLAFLILSLMPLFFYYAKVLDEDYMNVLTKPSNLTEGDWLAGDIFVKGKKIKATVHGLSREDIEFIRKAGKKVWVKQGIPFSIAFLISFMVFSFLFLLRPEILSFWV